MSDGSTAGGVTANEVDAEGRIFICWSGWRGHHIANALKDWLEKDVFMGRIIARVSTDIEKGATWRDELEQYLREADLGLLCITPEALSSSWVHYEAGVLARAIAADKTPEQQGRLFTFLLGISDTELEGPLASFQSTNADDERDTARLVKALLQLLDTKAGSVTEGGATRGRVKLTEGQWQILWQSLRQRLAMIPHPTFSEVHPTFADLFRDMTFEEPVDACLTQAWLSRHCGVRDAIQALQQCRPRLERSCRGYVGALLHALEGELNCYGLAISELIGRQFKLGDEGRLLIDLGLLRACEERRSRVRRLVSRLEGTPPFFNEAVTFARAETLEEANGVILRVRPRVCALIESLEGKLLTETGSKLTRLWPQRGACFSLVADAAASPKFGPVRDGDRQVDLDLYWRTSSWDFDRVMYAVYLTTHIEVVANSCPNGGDKTSNVVGLLKAARENADEQLDRLNAQLVDADDDSVPEVVRNTRMMPVQCALAALEACCLHWRGERDERTRVASKALDLLDEKKKHHKAARQIANRLLQDLPLATQGVTGDYAIGSTSTDGP
jgi:hypothetical protein